MEHLHEGGGQLFLAGRSPSRWRPTWRELVAQEPDLAGIEATVAFTGRPLRAMEWRTIEGLVGDRVGPFSLAALHPLFGEAASYEAAMERLRAVPASTRRWPRRRRSW